jgi:hypothetical protein
VPLDAKEGGTDGLESFRGRNSQPPAGAPGNPGATRHRLPLDARALNRRGDRLRRVRELLDSAARVALDGATPPTVRGE